MDAHPAMTRTAMLAALFVATGSAAANAVLAGGWPLALLALAFGALWLRDYRRGRHSLASPLLTGFVILAAVSVGVTGGRVLAPLTVVAALAAWDLDRFAARLNDVSTGSGSVQDPAERLSLEVQHLRRVLIVSALGLALAWLAEAVRLQLAFGVAVSLGLLAVLGLSQMVRALLRESD